MPKSPLLLVLLAYISGIIIADITDIHWVLIFACWGFLFLLLIIFIFWKRREFQFRRFISSLILIVFAFSGMVAYQFNTPTTYRNDYSLKYLENDQLVGEIIEFNEGQGKYNKAILEIEKIIKPNHQIHVQGKLLCYISKENPTLTEGNIILISKKTIPIKNKNNPGEFNAERYWKNRGITKISFLSDNTVKVIAKRKRFINFWSKSRNYFIDVIQSKISKENQGLVIALSLGDKSNLSIENRDYFANAGAMHVLAVSGMHVGILLGFVQFFFKRIRFFRNRNAYLYFSLIFLWSFAFLTGLPASVFRAVSMFSILVIGQLLGKKLISFQGLFASALFLLIINPLFLFDIGFQLSYLAMIGIGLFFRPIANLLTIKNKIIKWLWEGTAIGLAAQIGTVPLSLYYFNQFPNYFLLSNVGILFIASIALIGTVLFLLFHLIPIISDWLAYALDFVFTLFNGFIEWINTLPSVISTGFTPSLTLIFIIYLLILSTYLFWQARKENLVKLGIGLLFISSVFLIINREQNKHRNEIVILNHSVKTILVKEEEQLFVIYDNRKEMNSINLRYLIHGYQIAAGVEPHFIPFSKDTELEIGEKFYGIYNDAGMGINYNENKFFLIDKSWKSPPDSTYKIVNGSWAPTIPDSIANYSTKSKALKIIL